MVQTTSHIFTGRVEVESNLRVGTSHLFVDTANHRVGINEHDPDANLHVNGNAYISSDLTVGTNIHASGNVVAASFEGDGSLLTGIASNLEQIVNNGNVTSNTVQFTNSDTSIVTSGNVEVGGKLSVNSLTPGTVPYVDGNKTLVDSRITHGIDTVTITSNLEVTGNILMAGESYKIDSQSLEVKDRIIGIAYNNTLSGADTGILMEYPTKNVALVHHGASGNPYAQEFTIGYTQNTATDSTIVNDTTNVITVNVLGDLHTQNNMTVDSGGSYFGDGTTLTGVALETDMTSNAARIANIETVNGTQTGLITGLRTDMTSNAARVSTLEDANTVQAGLITTLTNDLSDNAGRITTLEAANTVQAGLITAIETDVTGNAARITTLEAANTVQAGLITAIETDVTDNAARITTLEDANTVQAGLITTIETDIADNAARITNLDTDLSDNASRVSVLEATDAVYAGLLMGLRTDVDDNDSRISNLTFNDVVNVNNATSNTVQFTNPTTALTTDLISNVGIKVDQLHNVNLVGPLADQLLVYDGTDWVNDYPRHTYIQIRNDTTGSIDAGDAVYVKGTHNANILNVGLADSSDPTKMPSVGLSNQLLTPGQQGTAVAYGKALSVATGTFVEGETVYVSNTVPGGLSNVKPFNNDLIQNIGLVTKIHPTNGAVFVTGIGRANDVPNAQIVLDEDAINYVYVNNVNNDFKKIEPSNLLTQLQTFEQVSAAGNVVSNTMEFNNVTTGLVTVANVEVGSNLSIAGITDPVNKHLPMVGLDGYLEKSPIYFAPDGTYVVSAAEAEFTGNLTLSGNTTIVSSTSVTIEDRIFGIGANNEVHNLDTGFMMEHKDGGVYANIALIYHADEHRFSVGYTQNTFADDHILHFEDEDHQMLVDLRGNVLVQNSLTVANGSYFGDGTTLTGVALSSDLTSNAARISNLEDSNVNIWSNLASNVIRISNLEASNVDIWSNLASNVARIETLETANAVQEALITAIEGDMTSNAARIATLELANTVQELLITAIETDMTSNSGRIDALEPRVTNLEYSNAGIWSNLASNVTRIENLETSNANIWSNLASNVTRIGNLETNLSDNSSRIDALTLGDVVDVGNVTSNTVQFINATTSLVASGNVVVTGNVTSTTGRINKVATVGTTKTFVVTVSGGVFYIDGVQQDTLELHQYQTYIFDQSDASNATHPIRFSTTTNGTHNGGAEYQFGVSHTGTPGSTGAFTTFVVPVGAPSTLHYYCENHSGMGSSLSVSTLAELIVTGRTVVSGNVEASSFIGDGSQLTNIASNLQAITDNGNVTSNSIQFTNTGTSIKASGTIEAVSFTGDGSQLTGIATTLQAVSDNGNVTSNTILLSNVTTGLVADGNVHALKFIGDGSELSGITPTLSAVLDTGNTSSNTILLTNVTTGLVADGNVHALKFIGSGSELTDIATTLQAVSDNSNSTSNTLLLTNATTGLVADGNVHALKFIGDGSELQNLPNAGVWETNEEQEIYYTGNNVGISNANPGHNLSVGSNLYVDDTGSNVLVISGNAAMSSLTLGQFSIVASYGLDDILNTSNISSNTMQLTNATTGLVVSSNIVVTGNVTAAYLHGDASNVTGITSNLHQIAENGNVTSNTLQFTNATTGFVTTANVEVGGELTVSGNVAVDTDTLFVDSVNDRVGVGTSSPNANLHVEGNVYVSSNLKVDTTTISTLFVGLPTVSWATSIGGTGNDNGKEIATDSGGNVYVIGHYSGSVTIGSTTLTSVGSTDAFVAKYDTSGTVQWATSIGGTSNDFGYGITTDSGGNVYVIGSYIGTVTIGSTTLTNTDTYDAFVAKYDTSGTVQWATSIGGTGSEDGYDIATDSSGNVYVTGIYLGTVTIGSTTLTSTSSYDAFVVKYDTSGTVQWAKSIGGSAGPDYGYGIATDSSGNVYVIGRYYGNTITFAPGTTLTNTNQDDTGGEFATTDVFVVKYDTSGTVQWARGFGGSNNDLGYGIATDSSGNVYVTGKFYGSSVTIGSTTLTGSNFDNAFVAKYDTSGTVQWARGISGATAGDGIATDSGGNVYVIGHYSGSVTIGSTTLTSVGSADVFVAKYDTSGTVQWARSIGGTSTDFGYGIATDSGGNVYVIGTYGGTVTFASGTTLTSTGSYDAFVAKYSQPKYLHINTGIEVGTANLSVDTVSGRVGIGTATPRTNLHIGQQLNSQGDKNTIPAAGLGISADFPSSTHAWFAHRVNATGDEYWGLAVGTIYDGASYLQNLNKNSGTYYDLLLQPNGGNVGIGTTDPGAKFQVNGLGFADVANSSRSYFLYSSTGLTQNTGTWGNASIYATDSIVTGSYIASIQGTVGASDERIKKEVSDINDGSALETLRLLKPKQYKYKDEISRGTDPVWGFIAQEVRETLPYATQIRSEYLPNIYELATVSSSNVITFTNFNTSNLMSNANTISLRTVKGTSERVNIVEVVDEQTIRVDKDLSESIGSVDESGNVMTGNEIFVYGQEVDDFVYLKKDAIWTIATAALQEVDRQLQTEKARNDDLEARILALENA